jgi:threonine dehydrogenase-like Zn-dependent dehydrogenase
MSIPESAVPGNRRIDAGRVFDLTLPLEQAAEAYRAMDERRAIRTLLRP